MKTEVKEGKCIIFSAPSGAGKTTIVRALLAEINYLSFSISACTRAPRGLEKDGEDYYFMSVEEFKTKIAKDEFIEWEEVYTNKNALSIFIKPPNIEVLEERLRKRNTDSEDKIQIRIKKAKEELLRAGEFDCVIENNQLELAIAAAHAQVSKFLSL